MDIITAADAWAHAHPYALAALGGAWANRRMIFKAALLAAIKTKWGRWLLLGHEDDVLADLDQVRAILKQVVDDAKAADAAKALAPLAPTPQA